MEIQEQLKEWLSELIYSKEIENYFIITTTNLKDKNTEVCHSGCINRYRILFFTKTHKYSISVCSTYFGCQVSSRKPIAGEDWTRGNDLPDGKFNEETWNRIKNAIIAYELIELAKPPKAIEEENLIIEEKNPFNNINNRIDELTDTVPSKRRGSKPETRPLY